LLEAYGLPTRYRGFARLDAIMAGLRNDKKAVGDGTIRFVLPVAAGHMEVRSVDFATVEAMVGAFLEA
jgi:3-dehydroquinate synthetase